MITVTVYDNQPAWVSLLLSSTMSRETAGLITQKTCVALQQIQDKIARLKDSHPDVMRLSEIRAELAQVQAENEQCRLEIQNKEKIVAELAAAITAVQAQLQQKKAAEKERATLQAEIARLTREVEASRLAKETEERAQQDALMTLQRLSKETDAPTSAKMRAMLDLCHFTGTAALSIIPWGDYLFFGGSEYEEAAAAQVSSGFPA